MSSHRLLTDQHEFKMRNIEALNNILIQEKAASEKTMTEATIRSDLLASDIRQ